MDPIANVLVPVDGSDLSQRAIGPALVLAARLDVPVHLVANARGGELAVDAARLDELAARLGPVVAGTRAVEGGGPVAAIDAAASELGACLVVMGAHARGGIGATLLGSVAEAILRERREPVVLVGPSCESWPPDAPVDPVAVCLDGGTASERALGPAGAIADRLGASLALVTVYEPVPPPVTPGRAPRRAHGPGDPEAALRAAAERAGLARATFHPVADPVDPAAGVVRWAADHPGCLLALTTHARTGIARAVLGSVAMDVVARSPVPVLAVAPG